MLLALVVLQPSTVADSGMITYTHNKLLPFTPKAAPAFFVSFTLKAVIPFRPDFFDTDVAVGGILFFFHGIWLELRVVLVPSDCSNVTRRVSVVLQGLFKLENDVASVTPGTTLSYELVLCSIKPLDESRGSGCHVREEVGA